METNETSNSNLQMQISNQPNSQNIQVSNSTNQMVMNNQNIAHQVPQYQQFQPKTQVIQQQQPIQSLSTNNFNPVTNIPQQQAIQTTVQSSDIFNQVNKSNQNQSHQQNSNMIITPNVQSVQQQIILNNTQAPISNQTNQPQNTISRASPINNQQVQTASRPIQPINQQVLQSTPPIVQIQTQQPQSNQQGMIQIYNQVGMQSNSQTPMLNNSKQQSQIYNQQHSQSIQQTPGLNQNVYGQQQNQTVIWDGNVEWQEKDRNNPNNSNKVTRIAKAQMISNIVLDQTTGQYIPEVSHALAQGWPQKIPLQLLSKQILDILNTNCTPPTRNLYLITDGNNVELRNTLQSIGVNHILNINRLLNNNILMIHNYHYIF